MQNDIDAIQAEQGIIETAIEDVAVDVTAIKDKTDSLQFTVANQLDANIQYVNDVEVQGTGNTGDEWGPAV
jgi:hypothetical protein